MMTKKRDDTADGELVAAFHDSLRLAFAAAMRALMEALPAGATRDIALSEIISAHERTEQAMRLRRVLN